jgi:hypothetical protein
MMSGNFVWVSSRHIEWEGGHIDEGRDEKVTLGGMVKERVLVLGGVAWEFEVSEIKS